MANTLLENGKTVYESGQPMNTLLLITQGQVRVDFPGGSYTLTKGDVIGICEICYEVHFLTYTATQDVGAMVIPFTGMPSLDAALQKNPNMARLFILSFFRQITALMNQETLSEMHCAGLYRKLTDEYESYASLCERYRMPARALDNFDSAYAYMDEEISDNWLSSYYMGLNHIFSGDNYQYLVQEPGISTGILRKGSLDFRKTYSLLDEQYQYKVQIMSYYFSDSGSDMFNLYTSLYYKLGPSNDDAKKLYPRILEMIAEIQKDTLLCTDSIRSRIKGFEENISMLQVSGEQVDNIQEASSASLSELTGSLDTILDYSGLDDAFRTSFAKSLQVYQNLEDINSTDEDCGLLRKKITNDFYTLYNTVIKKHITAGDALPMPVKMFLYFGYVDEDLAGRANSVILYNLANEIGNTAQFGVYTFYDWVMAVYHGLKEPSRNEFDEDYSEYIRKQNAKSNLTDSQLEELLNDPMGKVDFELQNLFLSVNKMTFGRITTFCPVFAKDNVLKSLDSSYVTTSSLSKALEMIRNIDYSAFYRESYDYDHMNIMSKELIHVEYLPDIILTPNVGTRGVMWQEIEGKKRNSPCRMAISIFHLEDVNTTLTRLTGEFRWELCKRVQGGRWNDVTERSLTSEYFDYIQFYRKNIDLSNEAKEKVRTSLQRAKNSFKEMFVRDYIIWVLFEGTGSPRLNKVARKILLTYCPFPAKLNATLEQNPIYGELLAKKKIIDGQKLHHLRAFQQKLRISGAKVPETLEAEIRFIEGDV